MVNDGSKIGVSIAPPQELNVRKFAESRASELEGLHVVVANRLNNDFRSQRNKRKRTTGHDNRVANKRFRKKQRVVALGDLSYNDSLQKCEKKTSRRVRRSILFKRNPQSGFCTSGDGTKRLRTHVWHAKRFTMTKLWEFHIPLGLHGKGKGSRALLKKLKSGVLIHDASYYGTVKLEGPQDILLSVLSSVLVPSPSEHSEEISHDIISGDIFGSAMLHHGGKNCFPSIAPVTYMWRPLLQITTNTEELNIDGYNEQQRIDNGTTFRELWVWIHAAAFTEAHDALRSTCERQMDTTGGSAKCISLEGQLAMLELIGSNAFQLLDKALLPASCIYEKSWHLKKCAADDNDGKRELEKTSISEISNQISSSAVIPFTVKDPRALTKKWNVIVSEENFHGAFGFEESETKEQTHLSLLKNEDECVFGYSDLWDVSEGICPPVEESVVCMEKYHQRREFIKLGHKTSGTQNASVKGKSSRFCPILLLKNEKYKDSIIRCSIILPLSWVKVFWNTFISNGACAIGLREKHWISCEIGLPYFPFDYPDCNAYSNIMAMEAVTADKKASLRPPSKTPQKIPIPPPWNCVQLSFVKRSSKVVNSLSQIEELGSKDNAVDNLMNNSGCEISETIGVPFDGFVARTNCKLSDFQKTINGSNLLLFPRVKDQKNSLYKFMKDEEFLKQEDSIVSKTKHGRGCFLRVLLRAYKEGVFEQGAVVCAPHTADIMLWTRSESDDQQLQISESSVGSYFLQLPSGKWELQIPEHPADQKSYRWPIGFVTTGFVRGSKKAMAGALCEASLLSELRLEQWKAIPVRQRRKEIYVLVRNMRSTAYRLALATIVLEQQEDDVKYM